MAYFISNILFIRMVHISSKFKIWGVSYIYTFDFHTPSDSS